jgi:alanine racemase
MDMFMVDIGPRGESYVGDEVVLIGQQGEEEITLETVAYKCNTIVYEILCGFNNRIPRIYLS